MWNIIKKIYIYLKYINKVFYKLNDIFIYKLIIN